MRPISASLFKNLDLTMNRRDLIKLGAIVPFLPACTSVLAKGNDQSIYDEEYDLVVVGSGLAGTTASLYASLEGKRVLLLEKMPGFGGNSVVNGGAMAVAGSELQKTLGITDSAEQLAKDMQKSGRRINKKSMTRIVADETLTAYQLLVDSGTVFKQQIFHFGGHSVPRILKTTNAVGGDMVIPMRKRAFKHGLTARVRSNVNRLIIEDEQVKGVEVIEDWDYMKPNRAPRVYKVKARLGVIMATGGFGADVDFRRQQIPYLDEKYGTTNQPGATSGALRMMLSQGAWPIHLDQIQIGPWTSPDEPGFGYGTIFSSVGSFPYGITVDVTSGQRFFNEMADRKERADAIMTRVDSKGLPEYPITFVSQDAIDKYKGKFYTLEQCLNNGVVNKFNSINDMAKFYNIPPKKLNEQVSVFNKSLANKGSDPFGRNNLSDVPEIKNGPYYAMRLWPKVHYCMGGVRIDELGRVISILTEKPINNLYAAGEATGGIHGASRLGGCAIAEAMATGIISARHAVS